MGALVFTFNGIRVNFRGLWPSVHFSSVTHKKLWNRFGISSVQFFILKTAMRAV